MSKPKRIQHQPYHRLPIPRPSGDGPLTSGLRRKSPSDAIGFTHSFDEAVIVPVDHDPSPGSINWVRK